MRRTLVSGLLLAAAAFLTVMVGEWLDLDIESMALLGVASGAVVALVPDASTGRRLAGFALGVVAALLGYFVRAALLPDTSSGRAVFAFVVVALCVGVVALSVGRLPLWSALFGAAVFAGAFEAAYDAAPPRVLDNSISALTALALCVAAGFLGAGLVGPAGQAHDDNYDGDDSVTTDELLEGTK